jgi:hypothetical protein
MAYYLPPTIYRYNQGLGFIPALFFIRGGSADEDP